MFVRCLDAHVILYFILWMLVAYIHYGDAYEQSSDKHLHSNRFHQSKPRKIDLRRYSEHVRRPTSGHHTHGAGARSFREFTQHWHGFREHKWRGFQKLQTAATHAAATHTSRKVHHAAAKVPEKVTSHWHRIKSRHDNKHRKEHLASRGITRTFGNPTVLDAHKHEPREFLGDMLEQQPFLDISEYPDTFFEFEQTYADSNAVKRTLPLNQVDVHAPDNSPSDFSLPIDDFSYGIARTIATSGVSEARHLLENEYSTEHEQRSEQKNRQNSRRRSPHPQSKSIMTDEHATEDSGTKREPTENDKDVETDEEQAEDSEPAKDAAKNNEDLRSEPSMIQVGSKRAFQLKGKSASDVAAEIENLDKEQIPILEHADTDRLPLHGHTAESEHDLKQLKSLKGLDEEGNEKKDEREDEDKKPDPEYVVSTNAEAHHKDDPFLKLDKFIGDELSNYHDATHVPSKFHSGNRDRGHHGEESGSERDSEFDEKGHVSHHDDDGDRDREPSNHHENGNFHSADDNVNTEGHDDDDRRRDDRDRTHGDEHPANPYRELDRYVGDDVSKFGKESAPGGRDGTGAAGEGDGDSHDGHHREDRKSGDTSGDKSGHRSAESRDQRTDEEPESDNRSDRRDGDADSNHDDSNHDDSNHDDSNHDDERRDDKEEQKPRDSKDDDEKKDNVEDHKENDGDDKNDSEAKKDDEERSDEKEDSNKEEEKEDEKASGRDKAVYTGLGVGINNLGHGGGYPNIPGRVGYPDIMGGVGNAMYHPFGDQDIHGAGLQRMHDARMHEVGMNFVNNGVHEELRKHELPGTMGGVKEQSEWWSQTIECGDKRGRRSRVCGSNIATSATGRLMRVGTEPPANEGMKAFSGEGKGMSSRRHDAHAAGAVRQLENGQIHGVSLEAVANMPYHELLRHLNHGHHGFLHGNQDRPYSDPSRDNTELHPQDSERFGATHEIEKPLTFGKQIGSNWNIGNNGIHAESSRHLRNGRLDEEIHDDHLIDENSMEGHQALRGNGDDVLPHNSHDALLPGLFSTASDEQNPWSHDEVGNYFSSPSSMGKAHPLNMPDDPRAANQYLFNRPASLPDPALQGAFLKAFGREQTLQHHLLNHLNQAPSEVDGAAVFPIGLDEMQSSAVDFPGGANAANKPAYSAPGVIDVKMELLNRPTQIGAAQAQDLSPTNVFDLSQDEVRSHGNQIKLAGTHELGAPKKILPAMPGRNSPPGQIPNYDLFFNKYLNDYLQEATYDFKLKNFYQQSGSDLLYELAKRRRFENSTSLNDTLLANITRAFEREYGLFNETSSTNISNAFELNPFDAERLVRNNSSKEDIRNVQDGGKQSDIISDRRNTSEIIKNLSIAGIVNTSSSVLRNYVSSTNVADGSLPDTSKSKLLDSSVAAKGFKRSRSGHPHKTPAVEKRSKNNLVLSRRVRKTVEDIQLER